METGETPEEAAIRETKEEVGVDVKLTKLLGVYTKTQENDIVFAFIAEIVGGTLSTSNEADDIKYFSINDLPKNISPFQVERIHDAVKKSEKILFKKQIRSNV